MVQKDTNGDSEGSIPETTRFKELQALIQSVQSEAVTLIRAKPKKRQCETDRGSKYRGVSKNGKKWQVSCRARCLRGSYLM